MLNGFFSAVFGLNRFGLLDAKCNIQPNSNGPSPPPSTIYHDLGFCNSTQKGFVNSPLHFPFLPCLPLPPMPLLHPSRCAQRVTASLPSRTSASTSPAFRRSISSSRSLRSASGSHEDHYDPPSGWLWGVPPGQKYQKEGWENIWFWGFCGSLGLGVIAYAYKPDTRYARIYFPEGHRLDKASYDALTASMMLMGFFG